MNEASRQLRAPAAAGIAGILFAIMYTAALVLLRSDEIYKANDAELIALFARGDDLSEVIGGLYLAPFAGVMFLWFVAVIRDQIGDLEDRFFATVFFGSGILFVALLFVASAIAISPSVSFRYLDQPPMSSAVIDVLRALAYTTTFAFENRAAGVFLLATATIGLKTGVFPRWFSAISYLLGAVLLIAVTFLDWAILVLPAWVLVVSVFILAARAIARAHRLTSRAALDFASMPAFRAPRGTRDLLPADRAVFDRLTRTGADLAARYGYRPIETPMFEQTAVFERGIGAVTDVVEKELFRIAPRTEEKESWSLRPEPTAGIVRAYVQHGMQTLPQPVKLTATGPMFRYDRPQAGRYRQFWQFDVEAIGDPGPAVDAEIIELGHRFYAEVGVTGVEVQVNSIGDGDCRPAYIAELTAYYRGHAGTLPPTERDRLERNALRLLDSKDPAMAELNAAAPRITDRLCEACAAHFEAVKAHLTAVGVPWRVEPGLVRGLDYYTRTAFEYYVAGREGQQQAIGGGGRYDGLVELLGGKPTPGIGFGLGLDRVALVLAEQGAVTPPEPGPLAVVVGADPEDTIARLRIATDLRAARLRVRPDLARRKLGRQLEAASRDGAHFAVILGDELASGQVQLRDLLAGTQRTVAIDDLARELARAEAGHKHG